MLGPSVSLSVFFSLRTDVQQQYQGPSLHPFHVYFMSTLIGATAPKFGCSLSDSVQTLTCRSPPPLSDHSFTPLRDWVFTGGGGGGSAGPRTPTPPPLGGLRPTVSCQRCRPQASMGAKGARRSMNTKGAIRKICQLCTPTISLNPTRTLTPTPTLSLLRTLHLS